MKRTNVETAVVVMAIPAPIPAHEEHWSAAYAGMHILASALAGMAAGAMMILPAALGWWS